MGFGGPREKFFEKASVGRASARTAHEGPAVSTQLIAATQAGTIAKAMCAQVKQHYVPQFYLREFLDPALEAKGQNVVWLYESGRHPSKKSVKDVGYEPDFYEIASGTGNAAEAEQAGFLEGRLQQLEAVVAPTLRRLAHGDFTLTPQQRGEFAGFIALTMCRTPFFAGVIDQAFLLENRAQMKRVLKTPGMLEELLARADLSVDEAAGLRPERIREFAERVVSGRLNARQTNRGYTMKMMFLAMRDYMDQFERMRWSLIQAAPNEYFITSDNAVVIRPPDDRDRPSLNIDFFEAGTEFFLPVSRSYILCGRMESGRDRTGRGTPAMMKAMHQLQVLRAHRQIYAPFKSEELQRQTGAVSRRKPVVHSGRHGA